MLSSNFRISFAIADDHTLIRRGLIQLIQKMNHQYHLLFDAEDGVEFIEKIKKHGSPDFVLMDVQMPSMDGFEVVDWLNQHYAGVPIIILTMFDDDYVFRRMVTLGVKGIVYKYTDIQDLLLAFSSVLSGGTYFANPNPAMKKVSLPQKDESFTPIYGKLNTKEYQFLELACQELTIQQIAEQMHLSYKTIERYRVDIYEKFKVHSRTGLIRFAIKHHLVNIDSGQ